MTHMFQYIGSKKEYRRPGVDKVNELRNRLGLLHHVLKHIGNLHLVPLALNLFVQDDNGATIKIDDVLLKHGDTTPCLSSHCPPEIIFWWTSRGYSCCGTPSLCLKARGRVRRWVVTKRILVSAPGPFRTNWVLEHIGTLLRMGPGDLGTKDLGPGLDNFSRPFC